MLKINKRIIVTVLLGFLILNIATSIATAHSYNSSTINPNDKDNDGIPDNVEDANKRDVQIYTQENSTIINSILNSNTNKDLIVFTITYNEEGLEIRAEYNANYQSFEGNNFQLDYAINIHSLIEYNDSNGNNIYDPLNDPVLQEFKLDSWKPIQISNYTYSNSTFYLLQLNTTINIFSIQIYFGQEYEKINDSLISPNEMKLNIEINHFNYSTPNSRLALYTKLESENAYYGEQETHDEQQNYSTNEEGVATSFQGYKGFFTWGNTALVDGVLKNVTASPITIGDNNHTQELYLNYPHGTSITHDPKIGIIRKIPSNNPWLLFIITLTSVILVIGSIAVPIYYYKHKNAKYSDKTSTEIIEQVSDKNLLYDLISQEKRKDNAQRYRNINITIIQPDFMERVNKLDLEDEDREEFIKEMAGLSPDEIEKILDDMLSTKD